MLGLKQLLRGGGLSSDLELPMISCECDFILIVELSTGTVKDCHLDRGQYVRSVARKSTGSGQSTPRLVAIALCSRT